MTDDLIRALRADLPSAEQEERLRRRLLSAGLLVGAELVALNAGAQATSSASVGGASLGGASAHGLSASGALGVKFAALSLPVKLGLGAVVAAAVTVPLWHAPAMNGERAPKVSASAAPKTPPQTAPLTRVNAAPAPAQFDSVSNEPTLSASAYGVTNPPPRVRITANANSSSNHASELDDVTPELARAPIAPGSAVAAFELPSSVATPQNTPVPAASTSSVRATASTLTEETRLLDRAFAEITAGHRSAAAALIAEHEARFPNGLLSQERERARARLNSIEPR